jgi:hypothetical protein
MLWRFMPKCNLPQRGCYTICMSGGVYAKSAADETHFLAIASSSVVELSAKVRLDDLKGKKLTEEVKALAGSC